MQTQSLKQQFRLWTALLVIIPSLLIMLIYTIDRITTAKEERLELIGQRIEFEKFIIESWITERARDVREISRMEAFRVLDMPRMEHNLDLMQLENKEFDSLSYIDRNGIFQMTTFPGDIKYRSVLSQPYFKAASEGKEYISDVVVGRNSGLPIINFSSPVMDRNGQFQGLILGSVRITTIETLLAKQWFGQTGEILLVDRDGNMIAKPRYIDELIENGAIDGSSPKVMKITDSARMNIRFGEDGSASWYDYSDQKVLGAYRFIPDRGWSLVGKISEEEILKPVYQQLMIMALSTIILILLLLPLANMLINRFKRPIEWLTQQSMLVSTEQYALISRNQYEGKLPRELRLLCDAFTAMSHKVETSMGLLKEKLAEIKSINNALAREVAERQAAQKALVELNKSLETEINLRTSRLKQSEEHYRTLVENSPDIICRYDRHYRLVYGNTAFIKSAGLTMQPCRGMTVVDMGIPDNEYTIWIEKLESVFKTGLLTEFETTRRCVNGYRHFSIRFIPEQKSDHHVETVLSISRDITDQKQLEAEISRFERLNIVGEMAASIGHEVRNPMTTVRGYLQYFSNKEKFADYREDFQVMIGELDRANGIIKEFLSLAKDKTVDMMQGNLGNLIATLFPLLQADAFCRGHEIKLDLAEIPESKFDDKEIRQLILNLVRNSFEAIESGGRVIIRVFQKEGSIILEVQDNGPGIPGKVMAKLGTPFVTTKDYGTGLGLPICYRIAERHGAKINVTTNAQGTVFTITFPAKEQSC